MSLVGPKVRPFGVADGHQVIIPEPELSVMSKGVTQHSQIMHAIGSACSLLGAAGQANPSG